VDRFAIILFVSVLTASAQTPADFETRVRATMEQSIQKQRASVQKQALTAMPVASLPDAGFFTVPWASVAPLAPAVQAACDALADDKLDPMVADAAKTENVDPQLVRAVIDRESAAKPCAISPKGAQGLMQLMPAVATEFGVKDPFDAKENVGAGTRLLKQLLTKYGGDVSLALGAYNAGSARVDREGGIPPIPETINYVREIMKKLPTPTLPTQ
jgi:soluble lytic murein transglycosylase-like protein